MHSQPHEDQNSEEWVGHSTFEGGHSGKKRGNFLHFIEAACLLQNYI